MKRILILGGTGMLGHTLFSYLSLLNRWDVYATARSSVGLSNWFPDNLVPKIRPGVDANNFDSVIRALASIQPDIVINCIGLIKQLRIASDPLFAITVNSQLPHRISLVCRTAGARMIHISTDCVFDGRKGNYTEKNTPNASDLYGRTKHLGEVDYPHCITLRTSIIGHELKGFHGLIEWFLKQDKKIKGFTKAIFSGLPTCEIANVIANYVIPNDDLHGLFHVSSAPISKYELLNSVSQKYEKTIQIEPDDTVKIDRSLDSSLFQKVTGYTPADWPTLVNRMHGDHKAAQLRKGVLE